MKREYVWLSALAVVGLALVDAELGSAALALNCKTAADCGGAPATCELTTHQTCAGKDPACPAGSACGDKPTLPEQTDCAPYVEGICRRPDELPCKVDADCGAGFHCAEQVGMACMGSGSTGGPGVPPSFHEECHVSRGNFVCELDDRTCRVDRDCAAGLSCQRADRDFCHKASCDVDSSCEKGLRCSIQGVSYCWASFALPSSLDVAEAIDDCTEHPPTMCAPRGYFLVQDLTPPEGAVAGVDGRADTSGAGTSGETSTPARDDESATDPREHAAQAGGDGCSLQARAGAPLELSWLAMLATLALARRRRAGQG